MNLTVEKVVNKRTGLGAGIGSIVGFFFGGPVGAAAGAVVGGAIANISPASRRGEMTPKRKIAYEEAMASTDPAYIRGVADAFAGEGLKAPATMLHKRAKLRSLPANIQEARKNAFREMMASDQPEEIERMATAFEGESSTDSAGAMREHAEAVKAAHEAGKSAKPLPDDKMLEGFADKLAKALLHFGPHSRHTRSAAANFVRGRGIEATDATVMETVTACAEELGVDMTKPPEAEVVAPEAVAPPPEEVSEEEAEASAEEDAGPPSGTQATADESGPLPVASASGGTSGVSAGEQAE